MYIETPLTVFMLYPYGYYPKNTRQAVYTVNASDTLPDPLPNTLPDTLPSSDLFPTTMATYERNVGRFTTPMFRLTILTPLVSPRPLPRSYVTLAGVFDIRGPYCIGVACSEVCQTRCAEAYPLPPPTVPSFIVEHSDHIAPLIEELRRQAMISSIAEVGINGIIVKAVLRKEI